MSRPTRQRNAGFTLIELMVALVIIGIGLSIVLPRFNQSIRLARMEETEARLASDVKLAISTAKATGRSVVISFDEQGYRLVDSVDSNRVYASNKLPGGISMASSGTIQVFPWGLVDGGTVDIGCSSGSNHLTILPTGKIEEGTGY